MTHYVHFELLLGKKVVDSNGKSVGRILSVYGKRDGHQCFVHEYHLGTEALLSRLGITAAHLFGLPLHRDPKKIPWKLMDLSDPEHPKLRVPREELPPSS